MSETKFTQWPWSIDGQDIFGVNDDGTGRMYVGSWSTTKHNAHLIAAAPLLYHQLKASAEMLESLSAELRGRISHDARSSMKEMANELFESLAIARGQS